MLFACCYFAANEPNENHVDGGCWPWMAGLKLCQVWALASMPCQLAVLLPLSGLRLPIPSPRSTPLAGAKAASTVECS